MYNIVVYVYSSFMEPLVFQNGLIRPFTSERVYNVLFVENRN